MRAISIFVFITSTSTLVVSDTSGLKSIQPEYNVPNRQIKVDGWMRLYNKSRQLNTNPTTSGLDSIPARELHGLTPKIPNRELLPVKPLDSVPKTSTKCQHSNLENGHVRHHKTCDSEQYVIFAQTYLPTVLTSKNAKFHRNPTPDEVVDWNNNLKILGLRPKRSEGNAKNSAWSTQSSPFTEEARTAVNKHYWPTTMKHARAELYTEEWNTYGVKTGLPPIQWVHEINRLHTIHKTPSFFADSSVSLYTLKSAFSSNACLVCKSNSYKKLLIGVQYCHKMDSKSQSVKETVPFHNCGDCAPQNQCNQEYIGLPKLINIEADQSKCESSTTNDCDQNMYFVFAQSYMPTLMVTGQQKNRRQATLDEIDDWNNNLKIHGLWPKHSKLKSTLPFTPQARAAVDMKAWPMTRKLKQELYLHEWENHGVKSGLEPLEYVREINRLHKLHSTPNLLKRSDKLVALDTLKKAFNENACLVCRPKDGGAFFLAVYFCHKVNSKTHQAEDEVVAYEKCDKCSGEGICKESSVWLPKLLKGQPNNTRNRGKDKRKEK